MANQSNSAKKALAIGAVLGVAAAGMGIYTMTSSQFESPAVNLRSKTSAADLTARAEAVERMVKAERKVADTQAPGAVVNGKPRIAPLFFAPELWQVAIDDPQSPNSKKNVMIDVYDVSSPNIHAGVENSWFIENGIADALGRSDGLSMDSDGDGFSNLEEYNAKTDPSNADSYPALVSTSNAKLEVVSISRRNAIISCDNMFADPTQTPQEVQIRIFNKAGEMTPSHKVTVKPGQKFGLSDKAADKDRFTLVGFEKARFADAYTPNNEENTFRVRDAAAPASANEFVVRAGRPRPLGTEKVPSERRGHYLEDVTVTLRVTAGGSLRKPEGTFKVRVGSDFTFPGSDIVCTLVSVDASGSANIQKAGSQSPVQVPKAVGTK